MKAALLLLALSLAANVVLAWRWLASPAAPASGSATTAPARSAAAPADTADAVLRADPALAAAVRTGDPAALLPALRAAGFPANYVREIILAMALDSRSPERLDLLRRSAELPFWVTSADPRRRTLAEEVRRLDSAGRDLARELLGESPPRHPLETEALAGRYRFLPTDKQAAIAAIDRDYAELMTDARRESTGSPMPERMRLLEQEKRADLAAALSPGELELYDLHLSDTAETLRHQLAAFAPTEEEFRALFPLRRELEARTRFPELGDYAPPPAAAREAEREWQEKTRAALGEARFAEYQRSQDFGYRVAREITAHYDLPAGNAEAVYELQRSVTRQMAQLRQAAGNSEAFRAAAQPLYASTQAQLSQLLGDRGAQDYRSTPAGGWLRSLEPRPPRPAAPISGRPGG